MKAAQEDEGVDLAEEEMVEGAPLRSVTLGLQRCGVVAALPLHHGVREEDGS